MPSPTFEKALPFVLRWEGGYVNHPADPGGATNKGVTQKVYSNWLRRQGRADADVRNLGDADMAAIYEDGYWTPAHCAELPAPLDQVQFDTAVNMGVGRAVRFLQEAVGAGVDGGFGPATRKCVEQADSATAVGRYLDIRERFYRNLAEEKPHLGVFLKGWLNRLEALRSVVSGLESVDADEGSVTERIPDIDGETVPEDETVVLRRRAAELQKALAGPTSRKQREQVPALLLELRNKREWASLRGLAEALLRVDPEPPRVWRLYAQALIEEGALVPAICALRALAARLPTEHEEFGEAWGLMGRVHKQRFADLVAAPVALRKQALADAIGAYEVPYGVDPVEHTWHGVNLLAAVARARRENWNDIGARWDVLQLARQLTKALQQKPADDWTLATLAEVGLAEALASGDLGIVEEALRNYLTAKSTQAFHVASTLRQFTEIWELQRLAPGSPGHALRTLAAVRSAHHLCDMLRARLLSLPEGRVELPPPQPQASAARPSDEQLEAVLGDEGPRTFAWYLAGVDAGRSVAAVRQRLGRRFGSGFVVRAGDLGATERPDELLLLTNFHVVNPTGVAGVKRALRPHEAEVVFEAHGATAYGVKDIVWSSPIEEHDASLLRLDGMPAGIKPLALSMDLPALPKRGNGKGKKIRAPRVYVIGHPGGRELSVSLDDNELLDHEGPTAGRPPNKAVWRVHYHAPTEGGSSGSPVFEETAWQVIALHHAGGTGMQRLNCQPGRCEANEGLAMRTLSAAAAAALSGR
jgi:lysozyme family protein